MNQYIITRDENHDKLEHYGIKGMKWGKRMARGHAGTGKYLTRKRQLAGDKRDLETLNNGGHLSVGLTKKRQAAFDKRDRQMLEKRIDKNEKYYADKEAKKTDKKPMSTKKKAADKQAKKNMPLKKKIGKAATNHIEARNQKIKNRTEKVKAATDLYGVRGVAAASMAKASSKIAMKGMAAKIVNSAANAYINSGRGNYYTQQGVHYARKAAIAGLSFSAMKDSYQASIDIGHAYARNTERSVNAVKGVGRRNKR